MRRRRERGEKERYTKKGKPCVYILNLEEIESERCSQRKLYGVTRSRLLMMT